VEPATVSYSVEMTSTPFHIGRRKDNDAALPLDSASGVSGHHLSLQYIEGVFFIRDEESTYGTSVNGEAVPRGKAKQLHNGDIISLGPRVKIEFQKVRP
jgi:pSer/pThr/pTyr-binding forkhead associated (FHA) protein